MAEFPPMRVEKRKGGIAQLVEQLTFNQWVQGSSPCASTKDKNVLYGAYFFVAHWARTRKSCKATKN